MVEEFKAIDGFEGLYEVSNLGRVRSLDRWVNGRNSRKEFRKGSVLKQGIHKVGYLKVVLSKEGKHKSCLVHRLVAQAFIPNPQNLPCVNHKDEVKTNNCVDNLEWCTNEYNNTYGTHTERVTEKISKRVLSFNKDGELIFEFSSTAEAGRNGFAQSHISACCLGKRKTHKGYVWNYD